MTAKKPLTPEQKERKNAAERARIAKKKAEREAALTAASAPKPETDEPAHLSCSMVIYDLPSNNPAGYADPSATMRRIGFRANLSCWIVPDGAVPHTFIHELRTKYAANVDVIRFDTAEGPRLCKMAVSAMQKEMADNAKRAAAGIALMEERHLLGLDPELAENTEARVAALKLYESRCVRVLKKMTGIIEDVAVAIRNFAGTPEALDVNTAKKVYETLQTGYQQKAAAFVAATAALKKIGTTDADAMAAAAAKDLAMVAPIADMLRENGDEAAADALQEAFDRNTEAAPDDGTFNLADADEPAVA